MIDGMRITAELGDRPSSVTVGAPPRWTPRGTGFRVAVYAWRWSCYWIAALGVQGH